MQFTTLSFSQWWISWTLACRSHQVSRFCHVFNSNPITTAFARFNLADTVASHFNAVIHALRSINCLLKANVAVVRTECHLPLNRRKKPISLFHCRNLGLIKAANHYHQTEKILSSRAMNSLTKITTEIATLITSYHRRGRCWRHTRAASRHAVWE